MSYDNNYETYLTAFGMPSFIVSFVLEAKETMTVEQLSPDRFKVVTETGEVNNIKADVTATIVFWLTLQTSAFLGRVHQRRGDLHPGGGL